MNAAFSHSMLLSIVDDLASGDVEFPTALHVAANIQSRLADPDTSVDQLLQIVATEPLTAAKILHLANSAAFHTSYANSVVSDLRTAIQRIGFAATRNLAISVAIKQLTHEPSMAPYSNITTPLWQHCLDLAALAYLVARETHRVNPHEAMLAGLVHNIGSFYLLSRAIREPGVSPSRDKALQVLRQWHHSITHAVLESLKIPSQILQAVEQYLVPYHGDQPLNLADVLYIAHCGAEHDTPLLDEKCEASKLHPAMFKLIKTLQPEMRTIVQSLSI